MDSTPHDDQQPAQFPQGSAIQEPQFMESGPAMSASSSSQPGHMGSGSNTSGPNAGSLGNNSSRGSLRTSSTSRRGFASMPKERVREIAREGGKAAHRKGTAHEWTPEEAAAAGRKGGSR